MCAELRRYSRRRTPGIVARAQELFGEDETAATLFIYAFAERKFTEEEPVRTAKIAVEFRLAFEEAAIIPQAMVERLKTFFQPQSKDQLQAAIRRAAIDLREIRRPTTKAS